MKRLAKALLSLVIMAVFGILIFKYSYKLAPDDFITDRTTFIYINKNINREKLRKFEETFGAGKIAEKDVAEKIKNICLLSQSKIYSSRLDIVGIADMGFYHPLMLLKLKKYFDLREDYFYELKDEYKDELGISQEDEIYLKAHRGLFFVGGKTEKIDEIIFSKSKKSLKAVKILNEKADSGLGALMLNQERERLFGIDRIIISGDTEGNKIFLDGCIYGDNEIIKDLNIQPAERRMNKYITNNRLYISTANLKRMDTFILRALSYKAKSSHKTNLIQELFAKGFADMISELNGEMVVDLENGNYLLGLKSSKNAEMFVEYLKNDESINIEKDIEGNIYICIGKDTFVPVKNPKVMEKNQFLSGEIDTYYGKIQADGFYDPDRLRIKAQIELEK